METPATLATFNEWLDGWGISLILLLAGLVIGWIGRSIVFRQLRKLAARTATRVDDVVLEATRGYWLPVSVFLAAVPAVEFSPLPEEHEIVLGRVAMSGLLILLTFAASRLAGAWFQAARETDEPPTPGSPVTATQPSLIGKTLRIAIMVAGTLLVLDNAGVEIKTLLTALGIGSLAIGLALQPTLSNFFAGLHLSMSKPIRVGDFVELEDGTQGHVVDIGWRVTKIQQLSNNLAVVPNAKISDMRLLNYSLPDLPQSVLVAVGVAYGSDLRKVEEITVEVARSVQQDLEIAEPEHEPFVRFHTFGDSSINFNVILRAKLYTDRWPLVHEFVKRLKARYDAEGIEIPFPQRVVHLDRGESA